MISTKDRHKILSDSHLISGFVREVKSAPDTPWLIQWVAAEAARMILCDAVVNVKKDQEESLYNRLKAHCRNEGISFPNLQDPLQAVARSLGLVISDTQVDFYDLLGVPKDAGSDQIRKAFRRKAYALHPDTRKDSNAETAEFIALNAAYETLGDPQLRRQYDQSRRNLEIWKERTLPASRKRKPRRLKSVYQLVWVLLFFIVIAYIFDMFYRENAITTGYRSEENNVQVLKKIRNIPPLKKVLVPRDLSDLSGSLESGLTRKILQVKPSLPAIPPFPAGFKKHFTSTRSKMSIDKSAVKQKNNATDRSTSGKIRKLKTANKTEKDTFTGIGVKKRARSINRKPDIARTVGTVQKSEKNRLNDEEFITVFDRVQILVHGLSLRKSPGTGGKLIREMAKGESGRVIGGPERVDGFIWWALKLKNGDTGWATEKKVSTSTGNLVQMIPDIVQKPPKVKTLQSFLDRYCKTYEKRDLKAFSPFFTADATENGKPLQKLWPLYRRTFQTIDRIDYTIELLEHAVELYTRTIHLKGRFNLKWRTIGDGREHKSSGNIELVLVQDQKKGFLVKKMTYRYQS
ncbi:MAG: DnaJ domain-containing protein [Desulfobacterales bacterium]